MFIAALAVALTLVAVLVVLNLTTAEKKIQCRLPYLYALDDPQFAHELGVLLGPPFGEGNRIELLRNGDEIFPAMLAAIGAARRTITFETYIYWSGEIGRRFADALTERARDGVKVHVLLDWLGSVKMDEALIAELIGAGIEVQRFHPPHWTHLPHFNDRTHRKLLVTDGRVGFTGGVGIAPPWTGNAQDPEHWRDTHLAVFGPVVAQMQSIFLDNWMKATGQVLRGDAYFPPLAAAGQARAQMFSSSPSGGAASMELMYLMAIAAATRTIDLSASYFVPGWLVQTALVEAMRRGVRLRIVAPGEHIDAQSVRSASRARWGPLLEAGATIAEYAPTMYHVKAMVVDGLLVSVGSTNFDNRSFRLNDEATLNVLDRELAERQTAVFEADLAQASVIDFARWQKRSWKEKLAERVASLVDSQL